MTNTYDLKVFYSSIFKQLAVKGLLLDEYYINSPGQWLTHKHLEYSKPLDPSKTNVSEIAYNVTLRT